MASQDDLLKFQIQQKQRFLQKLKTQSQLLAKEQRQRKSSLTNISNDLAQISTLLQFPNRQEAKLETKILKHKEKNINQNLKITMNRCQILKAQSHGLQKRLEAGYQLMIQADFNQKAELNKHKQLTDYLSFSRQTRRNHLQQSLAQYQTIREYQNSDIFSPTHLQEKSLLFNSKSAQIIVRLNTLLEKLNKNQEVTLKRLQISTENINIFNQTLSLFGENSIEGSIQKFQRVNFYQESLSKQVQSLLEELQSKQREFQQIVYREGERNKRAQLERKLKLAMDNKRTRFLQNSKQSYEFLQQKAINIFYGLINLLQVIKKADKGQILGPQIDTKQVIQATLITKYSNPSFTRVCLYLSLLLEKSLKSAEQISIQTVTQSKYTQPWKFRNLKVRQDHIFLQESPVQQNLKQRPIHHQIYDSILRQSSEFTENQLADIAQTAEIIYKGAQKIIKANNVPHLETSKLQCLDFSQESNSCPKTTRISKKRRTVLKNRTQSNQVMYLKTVSNFDRDLQSLSSRNQAIRRQIGTSQKQLREGLQQKKQELSKKNFPKIRGDVPVGKLQVVSTVSTPNLTTASRGRRRVKEIKNPLSFR